MKIVIATDAWHPQVNGVVTTLCKTKEELENRGHEVMMVTPQEFTTVPCPTYPEIRLSWRPGRTVHRLLAEFQPESIHICTEGPIGLSTRNYCRQRGLAFTTSFHTQFPEYVNLRFHVPLSWTYRYLRWFHDPAERTMINTDRVRRNLEERGFTGLVTWSRGVDTTIFKPGPKDKLEGQRPIAVYVGRVAVEKNIEAFLRHQLPGSKVVIGDGPDLEDLRRKYPAVQFLGCILPPELGEYVASGDIFVFPSKTDTFGVVMIEAMACGLPVAAYPVQGPVDVVRDGVTGALRDDLGEAFKAALLCDPDDCIAYAREFSWARCTSQFEENLVYVK